MAKKLTQKDVKAQIRAIGMTGTYKPDTREWRVNHPNGTEATAYYTDDAQDAIDTAKDMSLRRMNQVIVGNIGTVFTGLSEAEAAVVYNNYVAQSRDQQGRAAGEPVRWLQGSEVKEQYLGEDRFPQD